MTDDKTTLDDEMVDPELAASMEAIEQETDEQDAAALKPVVAKQVKEAIKKRGPRKKATKKRKKAPSRHDKLDEVLSGIVKLHPNLIIGRGSQDHMQQYVDFERSPFNLVGINSMLSEDGDPLKGGAPTGRWITCWGPKSSGKTAIAMDLISRRLMDHPDEYALVLDAENSVDKKWYEHFGINPEQVIVIPGTMALEDMATQGLRVLKHCMAQDIKISVVLVDSLGAMSPVIEMEGKKEKQGSKKDPEPDLRTNHVGTRARKIGQMLRTWTPWLLRSNAVGFLITHCSVDITNNGILVLSGGNALEHFSHAILRVYSKKDKTAFEKEILCKDGEKRKIQVGHWCVVRLDKSKMSPFTGESVSVPFLSGIGFQTNMALLNSAIGFGVIKKAGSWLSYPADTGDQFKVQGTKNALAWLAENSITRIAIEEQLAAALFEKGEFSSKKAPVTAPAVVPPADVTI